MITSQIHKEKDSCIGLLSHFSEAEKKDGATAYSNGNFSGARSR